MAERKIIAIVGATGAQGGGLARAILNDPSGGFAVRAITRDVRAASAKALAAQGAEVVAADLDNPASLAQAFAGAYGAYCVTFYWAHFSPAKELAHAQAMAEAARVAGIQHAIWSTLEDTRMWVPLSDNRMPTLMGKYKVPHFDAKGEANHFFVDADVPTTFLLASFYWENLISGVAPQRGDDGRLAITLPMGDKKLAGIAAEDVGKCAYGIFKQDREYIGERIGIASDHLTGVEIAAALSRVLGQEVRYNEVSPAVFRSFGFPGADDIGNMFQFYRDFEHACLAARDPQISRMLNPPLQSFDSWLAEHKDRIPRG